MKKSNESKKKSKLKVNKREFHTLKNGKKIYFLSPESSIYKQSSIIIMRGHSRSNKTEDDE